MCVWVYLGLPQLRSGQGPGTRQQSRSAGASAAAADLSPGHPPQSRTSWRRTSQTTPVKALGHPLPALHTQKRQCGKTGVEQVFCSTPVTTSSLTSWVRQSRWTLGRPSSPAFTPGHSPSDAGLARGEAPRQPWHLEVSALCVYAGQESWSDRCRTHQRGFWWSRCRTGFLFDTCSTGIECARNRSLSDKNEPLRRCGRTVMFCCRPLFDQKCL